MKLLKNFIFYMILTSFFFLGCDAVIVDDQGKIMPEVIAVFRHYTPLIIQKTDVIKERGLTREEIDRILNPQTERELISLSSLNTIAQAVFLRPANTERKDTINDEFIPYTSKAVMDIFSAIGDVGNVYPKKFDPQYILLNGSTVKNMRERIKTLVDLIDLGKIISTSMTQVIFLTGERDLFETETQEQLLDSSPLSLNPSWKQPVQFPTMENEAAEWIWYQSLLPDSLRSANIIFVSAKKKEVYDNSTGQYRTTRPTTYDTIKTWIDEYNPEPGSCLSVSSQPYVYYQKATIFGLFKKMNLLDKGFSVEGVGIDKHNDFDDFKKKIAVILDNFARTIYTEFHNAQ